MMKLEEVYNQIQPNIYAFFYAKTNNKEISEDLTQEVFYEAIKSFATFSGNATMKTWLFSIAKNMLRKFYRSKKYKEMLESKIQQERKDSESVEENVVKKEEGELLRSLITNLEEHSKEVVILRAYGELSFQEIGVLLNKSENYARVTFHRAKLKLHKELKKYEG
ncbi:RNA polymerase sigma factor [Evansella sp. AB-rgal1]|uniref:RNA polymerase sigma factor n=1 Tax=Evansella sp. AB-rgal1 TaxID=3242696 RepID=UPI00359F0D5A